MKYHIAAFFLGFILDLIIGDPHWLPHPIRLIGALISKTEKMLLKNVKKDDNDKKMRRGFCLTVTVLFCTVLVVTIILSVSYFNNSYVGLLIEAVMTYQIFATKCLKVESMKVYKCLKNGNLDSARKAVSMIVGRDTQCLTEEGVAKAAIETVAENTSDGVIAPMLFTALGGPILGFMYKAVNTMDSMVGYKNEKYLYFGMPAAKLDDFVNYFPARISAYLMILVSYFEGKSFSGANALYIYKRDNRNHSSPNSAQTESVCAGALKIQLAGDAYYFGKLVKKPYIGDALRKVEFEDIPRINRLMYLTAWLCMAICVIIMVLLFVAKEAICR